MSKKKKKDKNVNPLIEAQDIRAMVEKNTADMMRKIVSEAVVVEMGKIIMNENEDEKSKYEAEEVNDDVVTTDETHIENAEEEAETNVEEVDDDGWGDLESLAVGDGIYDLSGEDGEEVFKVYMLMTDNDDVLVNKTDYGIEITDKESGNEFLIKGVEGETVNPGIDNVEPVFEINFNKMGDLINETNLGYTDSYQKDTAMTTPPVNQEPAPGDVNDWNAGVPRTGDDKRRWGGANSPGEGKPFTEEEDFDVDDIITEEDLDEAGQTRTKANARQRAGVKPQNMTDQLAQTRVAQVRQGTNLDPHKTSTTASSGPVTTVTSEPSGTVSDGPVATVTERKLQELEKQLKGQMSKNDTLRGVVRELKEQVNGIYNIANSTALTNTKLAKIVQLFTECSTTLTEKQTILERFDKEVSDVDQINNLYESIKSELKNKQVQVISENNNVSPVTQTTQKPIYVNEAFENDRLKSIEFMRRLNNI